VVDGFKPHISVIVDAMTQPEKQSKASAPEEPSSLVRQHTQLVARWGGHAQPQT
jgi:hypothetical protein